MHTILSPKLLLLIRDDRVMVFYLVDPMQEGVAMVLHILQF